MLFRCFLPHSSKTLITAKSHIIPACGRSLFCSAVFCLVKSLSIRTALTERRAQQSLLHPLAQQESIRLFQDIRKTFLKHIAQHFLSMRIQTAGNHFAIAADGQHVHQATAASALRTNGPLQRRPFKGPLEPEETSVCQTQLSLQTLRERHFIMCADRPQQRLCLWIFPFFHLP